MKRISQWLAFPLAVFVLIGVIFFNRHLIAEQMNRPVPKGPEQIKKPDVAILTVQPQPYSARLSGYGQAVSRYELELTAQVTGQIISLNPAFETGGQLQKGDVLLRVEDTQYRADVAAAESDLAEARLAWLEEQRQGMQARAEWAASGLGGEPDSELVLRKPQLEATEATVRNKEAALAAAKSDLAKTVITAPFDCVVVERKISPGSYLQTGTDVATLYSTAKMEIAIALSAKDWHNLPPESAFANWPVTVDSVETSDSWRGTISRITKHLNTETRQRTMVVSVDNPLSLSPPLLAGTFVQVTLAGKQEANLYRLPGSALSQRGEIWYVAEGEVLNKFSTEPLFSDSESIYIKAPENLAGSEQRIVTHPLSSYLVGMAVHPVDGGNL